MVVSLSISPETEARIRAKAKAAGTDVETYLARHIELLSAPLKSVKELSGPVAEAFHRSGMSDDELGDFLEAEKHASREERRRKRGL